MTSGLKRNKDGTMDDCWFAKKYDDSNHYIDTMNKEQLEKTALVFGTVEDMHKQLEQSFNVPEVSTKAKARELPKYMLRTDKGHNTVAISQTCLPSAEGANIGLAGIGGGEGEVHIDITVKPVKAVEFIHIPVSVQSRGKIQDDKVIITDPYTGAEVVSTDTEVTPKEWMSKRFIMERYLGMLDEDEQKKRLEDNYDNAMKFIL